MSDAISVVVPARNEADTIASVIRYLLAEPTVNEVIVVNNNSTDDTAQIAEREGAAVVHETRQGMGHAFKAGCVVAKNNWVMKVDADLDRFEAGLVPRLAGGRAPGVGLIKGAWQDPADSMPMTRLLVKPAVLAMCPGLAHLRAPNSGIYLMNKSAIAYTEMAGDYAVDIDAMMRVWSAGLDVAEVDIGKIDNDPRDVGHYSAMAAQIMRFFLTRNGENPGEATLVVANDARDVIQGCLGLVGRRAMVDAQTVIFLGNMSNETAQVLAKVLAPYPSAKIRPLPDARTFRAHTLVGTAQLVTMQPLLSDDAFFAATLELKAHLGPDVAHSDIWLMAADQATDISVDVTPARHLRSKAYEFLEITAGTNTPRELFLSHGACDVAKQIAAR